jgi:predicted component of type VI protein secretion system
MAALDYQLTMRSGPTPGKTFPIEGEEMLLGRDLANEIAISDPEVSRRHARFYMQDENVMVEDLGSTNGSFLNGERISSPQQLRAGDVITLGESIVLVFENAGYDPDATVVSTRGERTVQRQPEPRSYQEPADQPARQQPQPSSQSSAARPQQPEQRREAKQKKGGFPAWLLLLIIAIVVVGCVIAVTLYFMPASWWCAITFNMLEGCPIP